MTQPATHSTLTGKTNSYRVKTTITVDSADGLDRSDLFSYVKAREAKIKAAGGRFGKIRKITLGDYRWATSQRTGYSISIFYPVADQAAADKHHSDILAGRFATFASAPKCKAQLRALIAA